MLIFSKSVKFGSYYQKSVNIGESVEIGRFPISPTNIGEFTEKSVDLASLVLNSIPVRNL
jgi:hypothetical protein